MGRQKKMAKIDKSDLPGTALFVVLIGAVMLMTGLTDWQQRAPSEQPEQIGAVVEAASADNDTLLVNAEHQSHTQVQ